MLPFLKGTLEGSIRPQNLTNWTQADGKAEHAPLELEAEFLCFLSDLKFQLASIIVLLSVARFHYIDKKLV